MTNSYLENLARHRRLSILKLLAGEDDQPGGGSANESLLFDCLEMVGLDAALTRDAVREDLKWMAARDLIRTTMASETLMVAHITGRGVDVARGRAVVDGIKKPSLGVD